MQKKRLCASFMILHLVLTRIIINEEKTALKRGIAIEDIIAMKLDATIWRLKKQ